jgi:hypothetical protein
MPQSLPTEDTKPLFRGARYLACTVVLVGLTTACTSAEEHSTPKTPLSIVILGDSVAAGEGINYGYTYDLKSLWGARWVGGVKNPEWQPPYPLCHDSSDAYGNILATNTKAALAKFACTGATYDNGLISARIYEGKTYRPAEFGDWKTRSHLNRDYDKARPDVVVLTFGADDVSFSDIVTYCATGYTDSDKQLVDSIADSDNPKRLIRKQLVDRLPDPSVRKDRGTESDSHKDSPYCTDANPGKPIEKLFWEPIRSGELAQKYQNMVEFIQQRGRLAGKVPRIVFTTYHQPLPLPGESIDCHDMLDLTRDEINYLTYLQTTLDNTIKNAVQDLPGVTVVDLSHVLDGHHWCSKDPWTYGLSILYLNTESQAPFHPTVAGQRAIANLVLQALNQGETKI